MWRFEDRGLTLRLFKDEVDALTNSNAFEAVSYGCGWIGKNPQGRWIDAHGVLPLEWSPRAELLNVSPKD